MIKAKTWAVTVLGAALLVSCSKKEPERASAPPAVATPTPASRTKVLAGDILVVDGKHFRLSNAFAPEAIPRARCWAEALAAREVQRAVKQLVLDAHDIQIAPTGGRDEYDRVFAEVSLDGLDLGQTLYDDGLAARPEKGRFEWCNALSETRVGAPPLRALFDVGG